ncbi:MAG: outer membrane beta-barrel protein [Polyangiaceae bacterium]|nr:outer membrane beta-barrel protein [Polyangiaceae bacterium]
MTFAGAAGAQTTQAQPGAPQTGLCPCPPGQRPPGSKAQQGAAEPGATRAEQRAAQAEKRATQAEQRAAQAEKRAAHAEERAARAEERAAPGKAQPGEAEFGVGAGEAEAQPPGPAVPPADQPIIKRIPPPRLAVEGGAGVLGFTGGAAALGPAWNVRVTGTLSDRIAVEGNYVGAANGASREDETLLMTSVNAGLRFNLLRPDQAPAQPFVVAGFGYAGWTGDNGDSFTLTVPVSAGAERMLTDNIKVGARVNFTPAFLDELGEGEDPPGGDTWSLIAHVGGGF